MENALSAVKRKIDKDIIAKHVWKSAMNIQEKVGHFGGHTIFARNVAKNGFLRMSYLKWNIKKKIIFVDTADHRLKMDPGKKCVLYAYKNVMMML